MCMTDRSDREEAMRGCEEWWVGDVRIVRLAEIEAFVPKSAFFGELDVPESEWLTPHWRDAEGQLGFSVHAFLIDDGERRMVVDTCIGNDKVRTSPFWNGRSGPFLARMAELGFAPESIGCVICTHLHMDHIGWNTHLIDGEWRPTFPNARYQITRLEWEYQSSQPLDPGEDPLGDSVRPIFVAGLVDLVDTAAKLSASISLEPTLGHTPGHISVRIRSRGEEAVITGDLIHHPAQIASPALATPLDWDAELARQTRHAFVRAHANRPVLVLGTHFSTPAGGRIVGSESGYRFIPHVKKESNG
jgi:glyoxylase-like metal-dependent hydrolase (beta-lactamase superfamily II)